MIESSPECFSHSGKKERTEKTTITHFSEIKSDWCQEVHLQPCESISRAANKHHSSFLQLS